MTRASFLVAFLLAADSVAQIASFRITAAPNKKHAQIDRDAVSIQKILASLRARGHLRMRNARGVSAGALLEVPVEDDEDILVNFVKEMRKYADYTASGVGYLKKAKFTEFMTKSSLPKKTQQRLLEAFEAEFNDILSLDDFEDIILNLDSDLESLQGVFDLMDIQNRKYVMPEDLVAFFKNEVDEHITLEQATEMVEECGKSGRLDFEGFKVLMDYKEPTAVDEKPADQECVTDLRKMFCCGSTADGKCKGDSTRQPCPEQTGHASCAWSSLVPGSWFGGFGHKCWCEENHCYDPRTKSCKRSKKL